MIEKRREHMERLESINESIVSNLGDLDNFIFEMGHYFRATHELCLFGVRGKLKTLTNNTRNIIHAKTPSRHSAKPEEMYLLIEANNPPKYLELFSRNERDGWIMLGDEFEGEEITDAIIRIYDS